jgi:hypothetical protein
LKIKFLKNVCCERRAALMLRKKRVRGGGNREIMGIIGNINYLWHFDN